MNSCNRINMPEPFGPHSKTLIFTLTFVFASCGNPDDIHGVELRVDANRDGHVSFDDASDHIGAQWNDAGGAVFLANIDDDSGRCPIVSAAGSPLSDDELGRCNDASDDVVNGPDDVLDLAEIKAKPLPSIGDSGEGQLLVASPALEHVRLFRKTDEGYEVFDPVNDRLSAQELRGGANLAIEAKDIVRNPEQWDGFVDVTLQVTDGSSSMGEDSVRLRVAPVMTFHQLTPVESAYVSLLNMPDSAELDQDSALFVSSLSDILKGSAMATPLTVLEVQDQWTQDFFETGYMTMPAPGGGVHAIHVYYRSANQYKNPDTRKRFMREAGRVVFTRFRGKDSAGIQELDPRAPLDPQSLNSFGNFETVPPYELNGQRYPLGRIIWGSAPGFKPDEAFTRMISAQKVQPAINIDTSWLLVGHVDETLSFLKADTPRGWIVLVSDARLAKKMLESEVARGNGELKLFVGKTHFLYDVDEEKEVPSERTISAILSDTDLLAASAAAAAAVDSQLEVLKRETGITDEEIIRIPFLYENVEGSALAYQPGTVNGFVLGDDTFIAPDPFGPIVEGKDIFKTHMEAALSTHRYTVRWIDNWNLYHRLSGEVHCGTNAFRRIPDVKWWETGR